MFTSRFIDASYCITRMEYLSSPWSRFGADKGPDTNKSLSLKHQGKHPLASGNGALVIHTHKAQHRAGRIRDIGITFALTQSYLSGYS